ncbi:hypothetical protein R3X27_24925 [Tropicimonas sp. TH_r6]|uniref:hypothetical protein n=1 Tax=Tropicimonas sp. TH_r6 TaxID=3082085 RepID=UPI002953D801|nr:hypothetical protein [Tropicimonas sp. TH_r6]MDV7145933.1 hypothetical protein [Tropicimonas sp. TH_r6]
MKKTALVVVLSTMLSTPVLAEYSTHAIQHRIDQCEEAKDASLYLKRSAARDLEMEAFRWYPNGLKTMPPESEALLAGPGLACMKRYRPSTVWVEEVGRYAINAMAAAQLTRARPDREAPAGKRPNTESGVARPEDEEFRKRVEEMKEHFADEEGRQRRESVKKEWLARDRARQSVLESEARAHGRARAAEAQAEENASRLNKQIVITRAYNSCAKLAAKKPDEAFANPLCIELFMANGLPKGLN